jgi:hypothetical protein
MYYSYQLKPIQPCNNQGNCFPSQNCNFNNQCDSYLKNTFITGEEFQPHNVNLGRGNPHNIPRCDPACLGYWNAKLALPPGLQPDVISSGVYGTRLNKYPSKEEQEWVEEQLRKNKGNKYALMVDLYT